MNDAGFGVFLTNLGRYNEGELVGRWYGLEDFPLTYDRVASDIGLDGTHEEYFISDCQGCPQDMGEHVSIDALNGVAGWIADQVDEGYSEEDVCALLARGALAVDEVADGRTELRLYNDLHTMAEVAQGIWDDSYCDLQEAIESSGMAEYVTFDAEAFGDALEMDGWFVDTGAGIFEIIR